MKDQTMMSKLRAPILGIALLSLTACSGMNSTQQRTLSGAGIGAGVGAVGTAMTGGCVGCGAAIGAGAGAIGGYIYDQSQKNRE